MNNFRQVWTIPVNFGQVLTSFPSLSLSETVSFTQNLAKFSTKMKYEMQGFPFLFHLKLYTVHVNDDIKLNTREFGGIRKTIVACSPIGLFWPLFHTKAAVYNKAMQRPEGSSIKDVVSDSVIFDPLRSQVKVLNRIVFLFHLLFTFIHNSRSI